MAESIRIQSKAIVIVSQLIGTADPLLLFSTT
jgi:hypothetical protein